MATAVGTPTTKWVIRRDGPHKITDVISIEYELAVLEKAGKSTAHARDMMSKGYTWAWYDGFRYCYFKDNEFHATFIEAFTAVDQAWNAVVLELSETHEARNGNTPILDE